MLKKSFPRTLPILAGYLFLGIALGMMMEAHGYSPFWTLLMSLLVYGGSIEYIAVDLLAGAFAPFQALLLSLLVDARHIFYGVALTEKFRGTGRAKPFLYFALTDETFSLLSGTEVPEGVSARGYYLAVSALDYSYWVAGSFIGGLIGSMLNLDIKGLDFTLTSLFVVLFLDKWADRQNRIPCIIGVVSTAICLIVFGANDFVVPSMALILAALAFGRKKL